jgi:hypothetical protein
MMNLTQAMIDTAVIEFTMPVLGSWDMFDEFPRLDGTATVNGVIVLFVWDGGDNVEWDSITVNDDDMYCLEEMFAVEDDLLLHFERVINRTIGDRISRAVKATEAFWAEQFAGATR